MYLGFVDDMTEEQAREALLHVITAEEMASGPQPRNAPKKMYPDYTKAVLGTTSELIAAAELFRRGYEVYRALNPQAPCDLMAVMGEVCRRVEVKTGRVSINGIPTCDFTRNDGNFDLLAVVDESWNVTVFHRDSLRLCARSVVTAPRTDAEVAR